MYIVNAYIFRLQYKFNTEEGRIQFLKTYGFVFVALTNFLGNQKQFFLDRKSKREWDRTNNS